MIISKFGSPLLIERGVRGERGVGFNLTSDGDYNLENRRLTSVAMPKDQNDAVNLSYLSKVLQTLNDDVQILKTSLELTISNKIDELKHSLPFIVNAAGDVEFTTTMDASLNVHRKRKLCMIGYATEPDEAVKRSLLEDALLRKGSDLLDRCKKSNSDLLDKLMYEINQLKKEVARYGTSGEGALPASQKKFSPETDNR